MRLQMCFNLVDQITLLILEIASQGDSATVHSIGTWYGWMLGSSNNQLRVRTFINIATRWKLVEGFIRPITR